MSQTGFTPIQLYRTATESAVPSAANLVVGELAINYTDGKLFYEDNLGAVQTIASKDAAAGNFVNLSYTGTLTGGTGVVNIGSGQIYKDASGNVGVGTSTPDVTFCSNGTTVLGGTDALGGLRVNPLSANKVSFGARNPTGAASLVFHYSNSDGVFTEGAVIDSAGNVGIGTTAPQFKLHTLAVIDTALFESTGSRCDIYLKDAGTTLGDTRIRASSGNLVLITGLNDRVTLNSAGNMGLGVTPSAWRAAERSLDISTAGSVYSQGSTGVSLSANEFINSAGTRIYKTTDFASYYRQDKTTGRHTWFTAPSGTAGNPITFAQVMTLTNGGNLLVGTTVDSGPRLQVAEGAEGEYLRVGGDDAGNARALRFTSSTIAASVGALHTINAASAAGTIALATNSIERNRTTAQGYFKASNTGSYGGVAGLGDLTATATHVFQQTANNACLAAINSNTGASAVGFNAYLATGATGFHFRGTLNGVNVFQVEADGNVRNTNNSYSAISDQKLKENIVDAPSYLDRFMQVQFRTFNLKTETGMNTDKQFGVIAQELEQVFPGLVDSTPDVDEEGNDLGTVTKSVKYSVLAQMQGKVIQEQQAIIEQQNAVLADLLARVSKLESLQ